MIHFTISAGSKALTTSPVGPVCGGYRLQVGYGPGVTFAGLDSKDQPIAGHVVTGNDWVLLRDDGVAIFDAKITFEATAPGRHVFDAILSGRVDLANRGWKRPIRSREDLKMLDGSFHVNLPIEFETSQKAPDWASDPIKLAGKYSDHFADLAKNQFVAGGTIEAKQGEITSASLDVLSIADTRQLMDDNRDLLRRISEHKPTEAEHAKTISSFNELGAPVDPFVDMVFRARGPTWDGICKAPAAVSDFVTSRIETMFEIPSDMSNAVKILFKSDWARAEQLIARLQHLKKRVA